MTRKLERVLKIAERKGFETKYCKDKSRKAQIHFLKMAILETLRHAKEDAKEDNYGTQQNISD